MAEGHCAVQAARYRASWHDYLELCKPRVVMLMLLTAVVGMCLAAPGMISWRILIFANLGIGLAASSAAVFNHLIDQHIDRLMRRTARRPIARGRVAPVHAVIFASALCVCAMIILVSLINVLTAVLTFITLIGYAGIYTIYLKHATPQNIVIGGLAGAAPPLLGWVAVTGHIDPPSLLLVLIIFAWTPPHFWALAIYRVDDYAKAKVPMLPVTHGIAYTKLNIFFYTLLLIATTFLPYCIGMGHWIYLIGVSLLNLGFLWWSTYLLTTDKPIVAMKTFKYSIYYLMVLFIVLLVDHYCH